MIVVYPLQQMNTFTLPQVIMSRLSLSFLHGSRLMYPVHFVVPLLAVPTICTGQDICIVLYVRMRM